MDWTTAGISKFEEAIAWFKSKFPVTEDYLSELDKEAISRAWTVAGVSQLDMLKELYETILHALETGESIGAWKVKAKEKLVVDWGKSSRRLELIFRNSIQSSYNAGRFVQLTRPEVAGVREFWMFDGVSDSRQSPICRHADGVILHKDHTWWKSNYPPLHHGCRSSVRALRPAQAVKKGITVLPPQTGVQDGFGKTPDVSVQWQPNPGEYPRELWTEFQKKKTHARALSTRAQTSKKSG